MTSSNESWHQPIHQPYWSQHRTVAVTAKKPDELTIVPWAWRRSHVWDFTCKHAGLKPPQHGCRGSQCSCERGRREQEVKAQSVSTVRLHIHCSGDSWSCRRVSVGLSPGTGTPHLRIKCWTTLILILDAVSQRCCSAWERRLCHRHWTVNQQPGQCRCRAVVFLWLLLFSFYNIIFYRFFHFL